MQADQRDKFLPADIPLGREYEFVEAYAFRGDDELVDDNAVLATRADQLEDAYAGNAAVIAAVMQFRLDYLIRHDDTIAALYAAIARWPDIPAIRLMLVKRLISLKRFDEAELLLKPLINQRCVEALDTVYDLALTHHLAGRNRDGVRLLELCLQIAPKIEQNPSFAKVKRIANSMRNLRVPFDARKRFRLDGALNALFYTVIGLGVLMVVTLIALGIGSIYLGYHAEVYVVNGLDREYTITLDSVRYTMPAHGVRKLYIPEGDISVAVPDLPAITPTNAPVHQSFFTRLFWPAIFVINPDRGAIIEESAPLDTHIGFAGAEKHIRYLAGQTVLRFGQIDLPFEPLPFKNPIERQLSGQRRLSLVQLRYGFSVAQYLPRIAQELPRADLLNALQAQSTLAAHPEEWRAAFHDIRQPTTQP